MGRKESIEKKEAFSNALLGKKIPVLTLDHKWYRLLDEVGRAAVKSQEEELNELLKRQGKLNTETRDIKKLKKKLMKEIVDMANESEQGNKALEKKMEKNKRLIEECNEKLELYQDELHDIPREIDRLNKQLMLLTMDNCYDVMQENAEEIEKIAEWVTDMRITLKKQLIRKQEMEKKNQDIYSYMHDIFGADVVDLFDMKYNPDGQDTAESRKE